jgi:hypothetical protein
VGLNVDKTIFSHTLYTLCRNLISKLKFFFFVNMTSYVFLQFSFVIVYICDSFVAVAVKSPHDVGM